MHQTLGLLLLFAAQTPEPSPNDISRLIDDLDSPRFAVRQDATLALWAIGHGAVPSLEEAMETGSREVRLRAGVVLERIRLGIHPETPARTARLLRVFGRDDPAEKRRALGQLLDLRRFDEAVHLIETAGDPRRTLWLTTELDRVVPHLIYTQRDELAQSLLEDAATSSRTIGDLICYLNERGDLASELEKLEQATGDTPSFAQATKLTLWNRALGRDDRAVAWAKKIHASSSRLIDQLLFSQSNWKELAKREQGRLSTDPDRLKNDVQFLGFLMAYQRLSDQPDQAGQTAGLIKRLGEQQVRRATYCYEALLINERYDEAIEMAEKHDPAWVFGVLVQRNRYEEALSRLGIVDFDDSLTQWFATATRRVLADNQQRTELSLVLEVCRTVHRLGARQQAAKCLDELAELFNREQGRARALVLRVCEIEWELELDDQAFRHASWMLDTNAVEALQTLYPEASNEAVTWWNYCRFASPESERADSLQQVRGILERKLSDDELDRLISESMRVVGTISRGKQSATYLGLCDTLIRYQRRQQAKQLLASADDKSELYFTLGNLHAEDEQWQEAAAAYRDAWDEQSDHQLAMYLYGHCLIQSGQKKEGTRLKKLASRMAYDFANKEGLARELNSRSLKSASREEWQRILRTTELSKRRVGYVARYLGDLQAEQDPAAAADHWELFLLSTLEETLNFSRPQYYVYLSALIHKSRAVAAAKRGDFQTAQLEIRRTLTVQPGSTQLAEDLVPMFDENQQRAAGDELYNTVFEHHRKLCDRFPESSMYLNNMAWMSALCNRRLDEALEWSKRSLVLEPDSPTYMDTLAEVNFRLGNRDEAIALARKCVELDPGYVHYQEQLARFRGPDAQVDE